MTDWTQPNRESIGLPPVIAADAPPEEPPEAPPTEPEPEPEPEPPTEPPTETEPQ